MSLADRMMLSGDQWDRIAPHIIGDHRSPGPSGHNNCLFVEAVLWIMRTGAPWRDLPESFGNWNSIFRRFSRWSEKGVWQRLFAAMSDDPDLEYLILDSTVIRAHQHAAGAPKAAGDQAIGRSRGGLSTKIHVAVRGLGCAVRLILTAGQRGDAPQAAALLGDDRPAVVLADTAYDADHFRDRIEAAGATAVIPNNPSRASKRPFDEALYKERHLVECFFAKLKQFRRVATRYDKTFRNYLDMIRLAATMIWLR